MKTSLPQPVFSLVVNIFRSRADLPTFLQELRAFATREANRFTVEAVFVVDGSPDDSLEFLRAELTNAQSFSWKLITLSRNFGAPFALRCGIANATGDYSAQIAPDLQEPFELVSRSFEALSRSGVDICLGQRERRDDPLSTRILSGTFWWLYRRLVQKDVPPGGIDFCAYNRVVRDELTRVKDRGSFFVGNIFSLGFRRQTIPYERKKRKLGRSSWSLTKKMKYFFDSLFCFSTLPIKILLAVGVMGLTAALVLLMLTVYYRYIQQITLPGYSQTMVMICFFGGINSFGLGILGEYIWRIYDNTLERPLYTILEQSESAVRVSPERKRSHA